VYGQEKEKDRTGSGMKVGCVEIAVLCGCGAVGTVVVAGRSKKRITSSGKSKS